MLKQIEDKIVVTSEDEALTVMASAIIMKHRRREVDLWFRWQADEWFDWACNQTGNDAFVAGLQESMQWRAEANRWVGLNDWEWNLEFETTVETRRWHY